MNNNFFSRFWALYNKMPRRPDKEWLVRQYTGGRTTSLREMSNDEYNAMCDGMLNTIVDKELLRKARSIALHLMQKMGIDTSDWVRVNEYCQDPRIAGKLFAALTTDELTELIRKLRAIDAKNKKKELLTQ